MIKVIGHFFSGIQALVIGLSVTFKNVFRKPVTVQYGYAPRWSREETRRIAPRYRGRFVLLRDEESGDLRCTACGICAQACPGRCITVAGENRKVTAYTLELDKCLMCGLCIEACPFEALGMSQTPAPVVREHATLRLELDALAQTPEMLVPGMLPSTAGGDLRPGKKPFVPKTKKAAEVAE